MTEEYLPAIYIGDWNKLTQAQQCTLYQRGYVWTDGRNVSPRQIIGGYPLPNPCGTLPPQTVSCFSRMEPLIMTKYRAQYIAIKSGRLPDLGDVEWCCANGIDTEAKLRVFLKIDVPPCTPSWVCEQPLNGYEKDGCGNRRAATRCNPTTPPPVQPPISPVPPVQPMDSGLVIVAVVIIIVLYLIFSEK